MSVADEWDLTPDTPDLQALDLLEYGGEPDLVGAAVRHMEVALPQWVPRAGNTEMVLLEAFAIMLAPDVLALQAVPSQVVEQLVGLHGMHRAAGSPVTGHVAVDVTASAPVQTIPAGTYMRVELSETGEAVDLQTMADAVAITSESRTVVVAVQGVEAGEAGNGTPAGTPVDVVTALPFVERATLAGTLTGGRGPESHEHFMQRAASLLSRQTSTLVLPEHFTAAALEVPDVVRARTLDVTDPARPGVEAAGHVTVAAAGEGGQALPAEAAAALATDLAGRALASLSVHVVAPTVTEVPVTVTVRRELTADPNALQGAVAQALRDWLDPDRWEWAPEVTAFDVVAVVAAVPGVAAVVSVDVGPKSLPGAAPLARAGVLTVQVQP